MRASDSNSESTQELSDADQSLQQLSVSIIDTANDRRSWFRDTLLLWSAFISLALLILEFTRSPMLAALVACIKFGWQDILAADWANKDPYKDRGRVIGFFCLAHAAYKICFCGMILCGILYALHVSALLIFDIKSSLTWAALLITLGNFAGTLAVITGIDVIKQKKLRLWLDKEFYHARRFRVFPPSITGSYNRIPGIIFLATLYLLAALVGIIYLFAREIIFPLLNNNKIDLSSIEVVMSVGIIVFTVGYLINTLFAFRMGSLLAARSPEECWNLTASINEPEGPK